MRGLENRSKGAKPGRLESLPRTAAITQNCTRKKKALQHLMWRAEASLLSGFQARPLNFAATGKD
jgi:hypothetical protein